MIFHVAAVPLINAIGNRLKHFVNDDQHWVHRRGVNEHLLTPDALHPAGRDHLAFPLLLP